MAASAVVLTLAPVTSASAADGSTDPAEAPLLWCDDDPATVNGASEQTTYAVAWVPAGATVSLTALDVQILPSQYVGNGRGEYFLRAKLTGIDAVGGEWTGLGLAGTDIVWGPPPYEWVSVGNHRVGSWTNNTGTARAVGVSTWAERTYAGAGIKYSLGLMVTGGTTGEEPPGCEEEWVLAALGDQIDGGEAADPVNTGSGNFFDTVVDVSNVGALGDPLLSRTYNSMDPNRLVDPSTGKRGVFGEGWTSWLDSSLMQSGTDRLVYRDPTGRQVYIVKNAAGDWVSPLDLRATVVEPATGPASAGRSLEFRGGRSVDFDAGGRLIAASSSGGGETVEVDRDSTTHAPMSATFRTHGDIRAELDFTDTSADGLIDRVEGPGGVQVAYSYDAQGRLKDVSVPHYAGDPAPVAEAYEWVGGRVKRILTHLGGSASPRVRVDNTYDARGRVASQTQSNGDVTTFTYAPVDATNRRRTTVTHTGSSAPASETYVYVHDAVGTLLGVTDDDGHSVGLTWQDKRLTSSTNRGGAQRSYGYDSQKRVTSATLPSPTTAGAAGPVEQVTYCDPAGDDYRVRTITDAAGTMARFTYGTMDDPDYPCAGQAARPTSITEGVDTYAIAVTRYEWSQGLPTKVTDPDGVVTRMKWDASRRLLLAQESDPDTSAPGTQVTFHHYDAAGRLKVTRTPTGIETWYDHDAVGRITKITGPFQAPGRGCAALGDTCTFPAAPAAGAPTQDFAYRRDGRVTSFTDQTGETWNYAEVLLAGGGSKETETGPDGNTRVNVFDSAGRMTSESVGDDAAGEKATTTYNYGAMGRLASVVDPTGVRTRFRYDADSNLTQVIDEDDNTTVTDYDRLGRPTKQTDTKGNSSSFEYNAIGMMTWTKDRRGSSRTFIYDSLGRLKVSTNARGGVTSRVYSAAGRLEKLTDATYRDTTFTYDDAGRLISETAPSGAKTTYAYDADDRLVTQTSPEGRVATTAYDPAGRVLSETVPATGTTDYTYNARGDLITRTDATGGVATWAYDQVGQVASVTDALDVETTFGYDSRGNRTSRTDALGKVATWAYNKADQLKTTTDPLGRHTTYTYDALGRLATRLDAAGRKEAYGYDVLGQLTSIDYPDQPAGPGAIPTTTITYNNNGDRTKLVDAAGTTSWTYDNDSNLTLEDNPGDKDTRWTWDQANRRVKITYPNGTEYRNTYDANGAQSGIQRLAGSWTSVVTNTRDADGILTRQRETTGMTRTWTLNPATGLPATYQDAPTSGSGTTTDTTYTRDAVGRVTAESTFTSVTGSPSSTVDTDYGYDDAGQILTLERSNGDEQTYAYDDLGRRTTLTDTIGTGSLAGTVSTTYAYDDASQLTQRVLGGVVHDYTYDLSGRRTGESWTDGTTPRATAWTWDVRGALTGEKHTTGTGTSGTSVDITRRVRSDGRVAQVDVASTGLPTQVTQMVWDEAKQIPDLVWSGQRGAANETNALYGAGLVRTDCLSASAPAGCTGTVTHDSRGSAVATPANSARVRATSYGAYGAETSGDLSVGFGYLDEVHVGSLVHLRARDYDPATGTFLSPDLLDGVEGTTTVANTYHYANNDPLNLSDPTGLRPGETSCQGFLASVICEHPELIITTASITMGVACGIAAAPAGPFAAGAAGAACGGAVHRGLTAYTTGENPWAAALNPQLLIRDALIGGVTEWGLFRVAKVAAPFVGRALGQARSAVARVQSSFAQEASASAGPAASVRTWLRGTHGNAGHVPASVRSALGGRSFTSWDDFRGQFWKAASADPALAGQFSASNQRLMSQGLAPFVHSSQTYGGRLRYELHHVTPRSRGGALYDFDNLIVVTPRYHAEVLSPSYHYGGGR